MKALTLIQPWAWAVERLGKRVENRTWSPPRSVLGQRIAIHAGKKFDSLDAQWLAANFGVREIDCAHGAIVATAVLERVVNSADQLTEDQRVWFFGPLGWVLADVQPVADVACRGAQGLWEIPADLLPLLQEASR